MFNLSQLPAHTLKTHSHTDEKPHRNSRHQTKKKVPSFSSLFFFFSFLIWGIFLIKFLNRQTTGRADDSGTTDRLCSSFSVLKTLQRETGAAKNGVLPFLSLSRLCGAPPGLCAHAPGSQREKTKDGSATPDCAIGALSDRTKRRPEPKGAKEKREVNFQFFSMVTINSGQKKENIINKIIFTYLSYIKCNKKEGGGIKWRSKKNSKNSVISLSCSSGRCGLNEPKGPTMMK